MTVVHEVRRLRIRPGPGPDGAARARLLTDVAHRLLGAELDEALAGLVPDDHRVDLAGLRVRLEVDPCEVDERALAAVWAGLIRVEVVRRLAAATTGAPPDGGSCEALAMGTPAPEPATPTARAAALAEVLASAAAAGGAGPAELRALAARATDDAVTVEALARLRPAERAVALAMLRTAGVAPAATLVRALDRRFLPEDHGEAAPPRRPDDDRRRLGSAAAPTAAGPEPTSTAPPSHVRATDDQSRHETTSPGWSTYGGLVLLHHRLRPLLERACYAAPCADPVAVRIDVLAAVARPEPDADDLRPVRGDPLVRLLAGDPGWLDGPTAPAAEVPVDLPATDDVLRAFAADLPGFAASTPDFVRLQWIHRPALLVPDHDAVLLRLGHRPLDLLLDRLPYPIGALRLPWTPTLFVGWEG